MDKGGILVKDLGGEKFESVLIGVFKKIAGKSSIVNVLRG